METSLVKDEDSLTNTEGQNNLSVSNTKLERNNNQNVLMIKRLRRNLVKIIKTDDLFVCEIRKEETKHGIIRIHLRYQ